MEKLSNILAFVKDVCINQLFAKVPEEHISGFKEHLFAINISRYVVVCLFTMLMDLVTFLPNLLLNQNINIANATAFIIVWTAKLVITAVCFLYYSNTTQASYDENRFIHRHSDILFPIVHGILETLLFVTSWGSISALVRLCFVPIIVCSIPVIERKKSLPINIFLALTTCMLIMLNQAYTSIIYIPAFLATFWFVGVPCACFVSFTVYSWYVNMYTAASTAEKARAALVDMNSQLERRATHDVLTDFYNRRGFQQYLDETWQRAVDSNKSATILMIDVDFFKRYNDRFGHLAGDTCLLKVAQSIYAAIDGYDYILARYSGTRFVVLLYDQEHNRMVELAERVRKRVLAEKIDNPDSDTNVFVTVSIGVATQQIEKLANYDELIDWADECLYFAKKTGHDRVIHTAMKRSNFFGVKSGALSSQTDATTRLYESDIIDVLRDIGADCNFQYFKATQQLHFSRQAIELLELPGSIWVSEEHALIDSVFWSKADYNKFMEAFHTCVRKKKSYFAVETALQRQGRQTIPVAVRAQVLYDEDGEISAITGIILKLQKVIDYTRLIQKYSHINVITQLPNRSKLGEDIQVAAENANDTQHLLVLDVRDFKAINGFYGHYTGDKVLRIIGDILSRLFERRQVYSYNNDQYVVLCAEDDYESMEQLMSTVYEYFRRKPVLVKDSDLEISFTIIAVPYQPQEIDIEDLFADIDIAIQIGKRRLKLPYSFFDEENRQEFLLAESLKDELRRAVRNNLQGFYLEYQPIVKGDNYKIAGCEALLRWKNSKGEVVPPVNTVPVLEEYGLMAQVESWIIQTACAQCQQWLKQGADKDFFVHINLSPLLIARPGLEKMIFEAIEKNHLQAGNITLEIVESSSIFKRKSVLNVLQSLHDKGISIAIDDFGTGYSSLNYLNNLPVYEIKIDGSFVKNIDNDNTRRAFLESIIVMIRSMGFTVCVEGVETEQQANILMQVPTDYLQGYHFGRPMSKESLSQKFLRQDPA